MRSQRALPGILLLAAVLHLWGMARSPLPAQDGLKYIAVARQFQTRPWTDVVRGSDRHPLYSALIALAQPGVAWFVGPGPDSWRIAAQAVAMLASLMLLVPLFGLARSLFDERVAVWTVLLFVLLPGPAEVGHDTLSDALGLLGTAWALRFGEAALRTGRIGPGVACGTVAGCGYLARPEVAVVPLAVLASSLAAWRASVGRGSLRSTHHDSDGGPCCARPTRQSAALMVSFLVVVGGYALVKGEVSEKLAVRWGAGLPRRHDGAHKAPRGPARGLDDPRWDFSPKEESGHPGSLRLTAALGKLGMCWTEAMGFVLVPMAIWGAWRVRRSGEGWEGRHLLFIYLILFAVILTRHAMNLGYLSDRHTLSMVMVALPWAAAGLLACGRGLTDCLGWSELGARRFRTVFVMALIIIGALIQAKPRHASRWGHQQAGRWLALHAKESEAVLDTRGWAAFVSGQRAYDFWHVRQALTDASLAYIVVGLDELSAPSRRAETLRAILAYAASLVASFPEREGGRKEGVRIYRFHRPESWEGLRP
jgi:hypothetical protein